MKKWNVATGLLISTGLLFLLSQHIDVAQLEGSLRSAHYGLLLLAAGIILFTHLVRAWRWRCLLAPIRPLPASRLLPAIAIGFMANMLLPAHAGEVVRAYLLARREGVRAMASLGTVVVERVADFLSIVLIFALTLSITSPPPTMAERLRLGGYFLAFLCSALVGGLWFLRAHTARVLHFTRACLWFLPTRWTSTIVEALHTFASGLQILHQGRQLVVVLGFSLGLWLVLALSNVCIFLAFGLRLPLAAAFLLLVLQTLSAAVPSSPGFIGTYHAAVVAGLALFDITGTLALSVAIVMHAAFFFPFIGAGLLFLWRESLSLSELWQRSLTDVHKQATPQPQQSVHPARPPDPTHWRD